MSPTPNRPLRKPAGVVRPVRTNRASRRRTFISPAVLSAIGCLAAGAGAWHLLKTEPLEIPADPSADAAVPAVIADPAASGQEGPVSQDGLFGLLVNPRAKPAPAAETEAAGGTAPDTSRPDPDGEEEMSPVPKGPKADFTRALALDEMGAKKPENAAWQAESWQLVKATGLWEEYRDLLARSLNPVLKTPETLAAAIEVPAANLALVRHAFTGAVQGEVLRKLAADDEKRDFLWWLMDSPEAMQAFLVQLSPKDDPARALGVWAKIAEENPEAKKEYLELAVACALVFDRTIRAEHGSDGQPINPVERFNHYRHNDSEGRLTGKVSRMTAADLVWCVGVPVTQSELDWAVKKMDYRQKNWGNAYQSIRYDMEKAVTGKSPYDEYTFEEIRKKGGICADQSYYTAWTACAHAIPAAILGGDGDRGPHAWVTWKADSKDWKFSGRFGGYPAGRGFNPQTGESISEEEFVRLGDKGNPSAAEIHKAHRLAWAAGTCTDAPDLALAFLTAAVKSAPRLPAASAALLDHWSTLRMEAPVTEWAGLIADLRKHFRDSADFMEKVNEAEEEFVIPRQDLAVTLKTMRREAQKADRTSAGREGIGMDTERLSADLKRQAGLLRKQNDEAGIRFLYKRALTEYGGNVATFKKLAEDFFGMSRDDPDRASRACAVLESACRRQVGRGKGDYFDVLGQNSAWLVVASCYREAGNTSKADLIERGCASRMKMATKQAL